LTELYRLRRITAEPATNLGTEALHAHGALMPPMEVQVEVRPPRMATGGEVGRGLGRGWRLGQAALGLGDAAESGRGPHGESAVAEQAEGESGDAACEAVDAAGDVEAAAVHGEGWEGLTQSTARAGQSPPTPRPSSAGPAVAPGRAEAVRATRRGTR
jgi:hypothetical protein